MELSGGSYLSLSPFWNTMRTWRLNTDLSCFSRSSCQISKSSSSSSKIYDTERKPSELPLCGHDTHAKVGHHQLVIEPLEEVHVVVVSHVHELILEVLLGRGCGHRVRALGFEPTREAARRTQESNKHNRVRNSAQWGADCPLPPNRHCTPWPRPAHRMDNRRFTRPRADSLVRCCHSLQRQRGLTLTDVSLPRD